MTSTEPKLILGDLLRRLRDHRGLSQDELAEKAGLSKDMVSLLERGLTRPYRPNLDRLCQALELEEAEREEVYRAWRSMAGSSPATQRPRGSSRGQDVARPKIAPADGSPITKGGPAAGPKREAFSYWRPFIQGWMRHSRTGLMIGGFTLLVALAGVLVLAVVALRTPFEHSATIDNISLERGIPLEDFLLRSDPAQVNLRTDMYDTDRLKMVGIVVNFQARIRGYLDRACTLKWSVFDATTGMRVPEAWLNDQEGVRFIPESHIYDAAAQFWVLPPERSGTYYVRLDLFDDIEVRLVYRQSEIFIVSGQT